MSARYKKFPKAINTEIQAKVGDKAYKVVMLTKDKQSEEAFTVPIGPLVTQTRMKFCAGSKGYEMGGQKSNVISQSE